eukprot:GFUD01136635.1.p1 GENE.GFUD01136635.1~~GFUD01136635.1.p1  ORF type:complete len:254 (-),score=52.36 GFUD01136635.1:52-813(-)
MLKMSVFVFLFLVSNVLADPASDLVECLDRREELNACTEKTFENFRPTIDTGAPELDLPPLDPMSIDQIEFTFWNVTAKFSNTKLRGFKNFSLKYSKVDKQKRTWSVGISLPKMSTAGSYQLFGTIPPNLDLGHSTGDERLEGKAVDFTIEMKLGTRSGSKILVTDFNLKLDLDDINLELECLFPKNGKCCPRKFLKSCNAFLTKVVLRFINKDGKQFIEEFQPEISRKAGLILKDYLNKAIANLDAKYIIDL